MTVSNDVGGLSVVASILARYSVSITNIRFTRRTPDFFDLIIDVGVKDVRMLMDVLTALRASETVISAVRHEGQEEDDDHDDTR